ncbi:MAG: prolipoprotein diacylglyceryl transferase, partial [Salinicola sp.]|uniref:prolipoprotein diacylglyceryl transferase family protein n=1 Tax=Salinicola sp. TaxID=1978524 RepID=UPI001DF94D1A
AEREAEPKENVEGVEVEEPQMDLQQVNQQSLRLVRLGLVVLFGVLWMASLTPRRRGFVSGLFLICYGAFRFLSEFFRRPDPQLGFIAFDWLTMGQLLSLPMVIAGVALIAWSRHNEVDDARPGQPAR